MTDVRAPEKLKRPLLRWHGGKWMLAPWIISHFPTHRVYVEPYGGGGNVLLRKERCYAEIWNDLDGHAVNLFRVARGPRSDELIRAVAMTPFAREEFKAAYEHDDDDVERARRLLIRAFMGFGSNGHSRVTGFRANSNRSGTTPAHDWMNYPDHLARAIERLRGVVIENRDALEVMAAHDSPETLHYVDPPYVHATRSDLSKDYAVEMSDGDHVALLDFLRGLKGKVILSGYPCALYDDALPGWRRETKAALADGAAKRTEVLWLNFERDDIFSRGQIQGAA
jgi:DNA adenine methylase